jgi:transcriptional regulator with XRE-family HTH domain
MKGTRAVTTAVAFGELRTERRRLAAELVRLRDQAGLSGRELARQIGISQSKVSRIEAGMTLPSLPEVTAWADAVGTNVETRTRLQSLTEAAFIEVHSWRSLLRGRPHLQDAIGRREAAARHVLTFQPSIVPGLLQTADYAARVFSMFQIPYAEDNKAVAVAGRLHRQAVLHQGGNFEFLVTEAALRWRPGSRRLLVTQLKQIAKLSALESVSIGVIPLDVPATAAIPHGFVIYGDDDDAYVTVEAVHANVDVTEPADIALYRDQWKQLGRMAVFGAEVQQILMTLIGKLSGANE